MTEFDLTKHEEIFHKPASIKEPLGWAGHIPFALFLVNLLKPDLIVELGVHTGNSYNAFCQAVKEASLKTLCYGVDTWEGDQHAGYYEQEIYSELQQHHQLYYGAFSHLLKMTFDQALPKFSDQSIDLLHIDGCHTYEAVKHDFTSWLPKVKTGGAVMLHDISVREGDFGVWRLWEEIKEQHPALEFNHSNGLGIIFKNEVRSESVSAFLEEFERKSFYRTIFESLGEQPALVMTVDQQGNQVRQLNRQLADQAALIEEQTQKIQNQAVELGQKNLVIEQHSQTIDNKDRHIMEQARAIEHKDRLYLELVNSSSWKLTAPLRYLGQLVRKIIK